MKNLAMTAAFAAVLGVSALAFTATGASAAIVCNDEGDCWHVKDKYDYPAGVQLKVYDDDWKWKTDEKYRWHEHDGDGHGYWKGGVWIGF